MLRKVFQANRGQQDRRFDAGNFTIGGGDRIESRFSLFQAGKAQGDGTGLHVFVAGSKERRVVQERSPEDAIEAVRAHTAKGKRYVVQSAHIIVDDVLPGKAKHLAIGFSLVGEMFVG